MVMPLGRTVTGSRAPARRTSAASMEDTAVRSAPPRCHSRTGLMGPSAPAIGAQGPSTQWKVRDNGSPAL